MKNIELQNIVWKEDNFFVAQCLNIDISSFGETEQEALSNLNEAISLYFEEKQESPSTLIQVQQPHIVKQSFSYA